MTRPASEMTTQPPSSRREKSELILENKEYTGFVVDYDLKRATPRRRRRAAGADQVYGLADALKSPSK